MNFNFPLFFTEVKTKRDGSYKFSVTFKNIYFIFLLIEYLLRIKASIILE